MLDELFELVKEDKTFVRPNQHILFHSAHTWMCLWVFMRWEMHTGMRKKRKKKSMCVFVCVCLWVCKREETRKDRKERKKSKRGWECVRKRKVRHG